MNRSVYLSVLFSVLILLSFGCGGDSSESNITASEDQKDRIRDYFFPSDSLNPYIYVYADENRPVDEKFYRIFRLKTKDKNDLIVERYNAEFRITEGFTYDLDDNLSISDHMIVDAQGKKRQAKLTSSSLYPVNEDDEAVFISDFPAHIDSLVGVYKSKKTVEERFDYEIFGEKTKAIKVLDEVTLSFVNPFNEKGSSNTVEIYRVYAKGFGLTEWYTVDQKIHFKLQRILSNEWWKEFAQGPVVKGVTE